MRSAVPAAPLPVKYKATGAQSSEAIHSTNQPQLEQKQCVSCFCICDSLDSVCQTGSSRGRPSEHWYRESILTGIGLLPSMRFQTLPLLWLLHSTHHAPKVRALKSSPSTWCVAMSTAPEMLRNRLQDLEHAPHVPLTTGAGKPVADSPCLAR